MRARVSNPSSVRYLYPTRLVENEKVNRTLSTRHFLWPTWGLEMHKQERSTSWGSDNASVVGLMFNSWRWGSYRCHCPWGCRCQYASSKMLVIQTRELVSKGQERKSASGKQRGFGQKLSKFLVLLLVFNSRHRHPYCRSMKRGEVCLTLSRSANEFFITQTKEKPHALMTSPWT